MEVRPRLPEPRQHHLRGDAGAQGDVPLIFRLGRLTLALAIVYLTISASPAGAAGGACGPGSPIVVEVLVADGGPSTCTQVSYQQLSDWRDYRRTSFPLHGGSASANNVDATSLQKILDSVSAPAGNFVSVSSDGSARTRFLPGSPNGGDLGVAGSGYQRDLPPSFYTLGNGALWLVRSILSSQPDEDNTIDNWSSVSATIQVHTQGRLLHPAIDPARTQSEVNKSVSLGVDYRGSEEAPRGALYQWDFGDGTSSPVTGARTISHTWSRTGSYAVSVELVSSDDTSEGRSAAPATVTVGPAPTPQGDQTPPGGGSTPQSSSSSGPLQGQGPDSGSPTSSGGTGASGSAGGSGTGSSSGGAGSTAGPPASASSSAPGPTTPEPNQPASAGERIDGVLLSGLPAMSLTPQAPRPAAAARAVPDPQHDWRKLGFAALPALLLAGSATQTRWLQRRLPAPAWRRA